MKKIITTTLLGIVLSFIVVNSTVLAQNTGLGHFYANQSLIIKNQTDPNLCWGYTFDRDFTFDGPSYGYLPSDAYCYRVQAHTSGPTGYLSLLPGTHSDYCDINSDQNDSPGTTSCVNDVISQHQIETYTISNLNGYASEPRICGTNSTCADAVVQCIKDHAALGPTNFYTSKLVDDCVSGKRAEYCLGSECLEPGQLAVQASAEARVRCSVTPVANQLNKFRVQLSNIPLTPYGISLIRGGGDYAFIYLDQNKYNTNLDQIVDLSPYDPADNLEHQSYRIVVNYIGPDGPELNDFFCDKEVTVNRSVESEASSPVITNVEKTVPLGEAVTCSAKEDPNRPTVVLFEANNLTPNKYYTLITNQFYAPEERNDVSNLTNTVQADDRGSTSVNLYSSVGTNSDYSLYAGNDILCQASYHSSFFDTITNNCNGDQNCLNKRRTCLGGIMPIDDVEADKNNIQACMSKYYPTSCDSKSKPNQFSCEGGKTCYSQNTGAPGANPKEICYDDYIKGDNGCWEPKTNSDGSTSHCDETCDTNDDCSSGKTCDPNTKICVDREISNQPDELGKPETPAEAETPARNNPQPPNPATRQNPSQEGTIQQIYQDVDQALGDVLPDLPNTDEPNSDDSSKQQPDSVEKIEIEGPEGRVDVTDRDSLPLNGYEQGGYASVFITYTSGKTRQITYTFEKPAVAPASETTTEPTPEDSIAPEESPFPTEEPSDPNQTDNNSDDYNIDLYPNPDYPDVNAAPPNNYPESPGGEPAPGDNGNEENQ